MVAKSDRCCCRCRLSRLTAGSWHFRSQPSDFLSLSLPRRLWRCRCWSSAFSKSPFNWFLHRLLSVGRIQFSIRHLMILTFVVACLITIGKWVQPHLPHGGMFYRLLLLALRLAWLASSPFGLSWPRDSRCCTASAWWPWEPVQATALHGSDDGDVGIWMTATATEATAVVVSLLVVRSCGYRLVRLPPRRQKGVESGNQTCQATTT